MEEIKREVKILKGQLIVSIVFIIILSFSINLLLKNDEAMSNLLSEQIINSSYKEYKQEAKIKELELLTLRQEQILKMQMDNIN